MNTYLNLETMQTKKNPGANLEKRRAVHLQIGLLAALSLVLISLEWSTPADDNTDGFDIAWASTIEPDVIQAIPRENEPAPQKVHPTILVPVEIDELDPGSIEMPDFSREYTGGLVIPDDVYDLPEDKIEPQFDGFVEVPAEFPGGKDAMMKWIYSNIKYPKECADNGVAGRVTAKFTISKMGKVTDIQVVKGVHPDLDNEVIRVLKMMPDFRPAMQNQQLVPVYMFWPVEFRLE